MRSQAASLLLASACAGCQLVFPLDGPGTDGGPAGGKTVYIVDGDYDQDGLANDIDPCPLDADNTSTEDSDGDGFPDHCDPGAAADGHDCVVLLDAFSDRVRVIDSRWKGVPMAWESRTCDEVAPALCSPRVAGPSTLYFDEPELEAARVDFELVVEDSRAGHVTGFTAMTPSDEVSGRGCGVEILTDNVRMIVRDFVDGISVATAFGTNTATRTDTTAFQTFWEPARHCTSPAPLDEQVSSIGTPPEGSFVGIHTDNLFVNLRWIVAYGARCR